MAPTTDLLSSELPSLSHLRHHRNHDCSFLISIAGYLVLALRRDKPSPFSISAQIVVLENAFPAIVDPNRVIAVLRDAITAQGGVAAFSDLHARPRVGENIIILQSAVALRAHQDPGHLSVVDSIAARGGIATTCDRHASVSIGEDIVILQNPPTVFGHYDATPLSVVDAVPAKGRVAAASNLHAIESVGEDLVVL